MRIVVTGHRPNKLPGGYNWKHRANVQLMDIMAEFLDEIRQHGVTSIEACSGMALGIDQMFAQMCIILKVPWTAFIPCIGQESRWPPSSQQKYHELLKEAGNVALVSNKPYDNGCMQKRNLAMRDWALVDKDRVLLAFWNGSPGGTANMVQACKGRMELKIINPIEQHPTSTGSQLLEQMGPDEYPLYKENYDDPI